MYLNMECNGIKSNMTDSLFLDHSFRISKAPLRDHGRPLKMPSRSFLFAKQNLKIFSSTFSILTLAHNLQVLCMIPSIVNLLKFRVFNTFPINRFSVVESPLSFDCRERFLIDFCKDRAFSWTWFVFLPSFSILQNLDRY